jgi:hypothetical protein
MKKTRSQVIGSLRCEQDRGSTNRSKMMYDAGEFNLKSSVDAVAEHSRDTVERMG